MLQTQEAVIELLKTSPDFAALFPGGIWNRELTPGPGAGSTPEAFEDVEPDAPDTVRRLKPSVVVQDAGEFSSAARLGGNTRVMVFAYAYASNQGRTVLAQADYQLRVALSQAHAAIPAGDGGFRYGEFRIGMRTPILEERTYNGTLFCSWQLIFHTALLDMAAR